MKQVKYTEDQYNSFRAIYNRFKAKNYQELKQLADDKYSDTEHPRDDVQVGINVFYDDIMRGNIRCLISLYTVHDQPWWHFWDSAVLVEDFIIAPNGEYVGQ